MLENLKKEIDSFIKDMEENIKDSETLLYVKERTLTFIEKIKEELEKQLALNEERISDIAKKQELTDILLQELKQRLDTVYEDIYEEEEDFTIICPYCNFEFETEINEEINEIKCPECGNIIELDWNGNPDDDNNCGGRCSHCGGCN